MKFVLVAASLVGLVAGQASLGALPQCAIPCINNAIAATGCSAADVHCYCTATAFLCTIAPCVEANCSVADQTATQTTAQGFCSAANPPVQLPSFASLLNGTACGTGGASASASSAAAASGTSSAAAAASESSTAAASSTESAAAASSSAAAKSGSGRIEGDMRIGMALGAMIGVVAIAFFAV